MTEQEKLTVLNSMEVIESDGNGDELYYVLVEYNQENLQKLSQVVSNIDEYLEKYGDVDNTKDCIEISVAAWDYAGATYFNGTTFVSEN